MTVDLEAAVPVLPGDDAGKLAAYSQLPVYALGGMNIDDIPTAWAAGFQDIAAIRGLFGNTD